MACGPILFASRRRRPSSTGRQDTYPLIERREEHHGPPHRGSSRTSASANARVLSWIESHETWRYKARKKGKLTKPPPPQWTQAGRTKDQATPTLLISEDIPTPLSPLVAPPDFDALSRASSRSHAGPSREPSRLPAIPETAVLSRAPPHARERERAEEGKPRPPPPPPIVAAAPLAGVSSSRPPRPPPNVRTQEGKPRLVQRNPTTIVFGPYGYDRPSEDVVVPNVSRVGNGKSTAPNIGDGARTVGNGATRVSKPQEPSTTTKDISPKQAPRRSGLGSSPTTNGDAGRQSHEVSTSRSSKRQTFPANNPPVVAPLSRNSTVSTLAQRNDIGAVKGPPRPAEAARMANTRTRFIEMS
ncbi:hypothetical protein PLICRDRAFT_699492, partial [Plicaturopsis crispa FD-325 SS-3]